MAIQAPARIGIDESAQFFIFDGIHQLQQGLTLLGIDTLERM